MIPNKLLKLYVIGENMDRRQRKTREAIFSAFTALLEKKAYNQITVQEIIDAANVGRATFYAHFETKDYLLKELCEELFDHIMGTAAGIEEDRYRCDCGTPDDSVFLHLIRHLQENDSKLLSLLSSQNNEMFLRYFKSNLKKLIITQYAEKGLLKDSGLPEDYVVNHISSSFVETVEWWISHKMKESPQTLTEYYLSVIEPLICGKEGENT